jgi:hypothetical protein
MILEKKPQRWSGAAMTCYEEITRCVPRFRLRLGWLEFTVVYKAVLQYKGIHPHIVDCC